MNTITEVHLVDDDETILITLGRVIEKAGYSVSTYNSGTKFLNEFDSNGFGCVILDVSMPKMSGIEVHAELRKRNTSMPVFYMTGNVSEPLLLEAIKDNPVQVLDKPFPVDSLIELLEICLTQEKYRHSKTDNGENQGTV